MGYTLCRAFLTIRGNWTLAAASQQSNRMHQEFHISEAEMYNTALKNLCQKVSARLLSRAVGVWITMAVRRCFFSMHVNCRANEQQVNALWLWEKILLTGAVKKAASSIYKNWRVHRQREVAIRLLRRTMAAWLAGKARCGFLQHP